MTIAFTEPTTAKKEYIVSQMHQVTSLSEDKREEFQDIMKDLRLKIDAEIRDKTFPKGDNGQNHYFGIRALNNPKIPVPGRRDVQLTGEEFFGVNRFVDELLDIADIQWWALYKGRSWSLHTRSSEGEHLECLGSWGDLEAAVILVNGVPLSVDEMFSFYRTFMNRKKRDFGQKYNRERIKKSLEKIKQGQIPKHIEDLVSLGLVENASLTYTGRSLLDDKTAQQWKEVQDRLSIPLDHHGFGNLKDLGSHGTISDIVFYLETIGIKALLEKPYLTEAEFTELKRKDADFVKKFGFSVVQESMIPDLPSLTFNMNPIIKEIISEIELKYAKKSVDIEALVLDEFQRKYGTAGHAKVAGIVNSIVDASSLKSLESAVTSIEDIIKKSGRFANPLKLVLQSALVKKYDAILASTSLEDRYIGLEFFKAYDRFITAKQKSVLVNETIALFESEYSNISPELRKKLLTNYLTSISVYDKKAVSRILDLTFKDVHDKNSLQDAIYVLTEVRKDVSGKDNFPKEINDQYYYKDYVKNYFSALFRNASFTDKLKVCVEYRDALSGILGYILPPDLARNDIHDLLFLGKLLPHYIDKLDQYEQFAQDFSSNKNGNSASGTDNVLFVKLFNDVDKKILDSLAANYFTMPSYSFDAKRNLLKISSSSIKSDDVSRLVQSALFVSYIMAAEKDPTLIYDPNEQRVFFVDTAKIGYKLGICAPQPFEYNSSLMLDHILRQSLSESKSKLKKDIYSSSLEKIIFKNDYFTNKKYNLEDKYIKNYNKIYYNDYNLYKKI